ncbi:MAG: hemin receptor [Gammaproteobacteria bacterium TMED119]|nr:MAG: hemin receptor [Gammaproteobacteria bacterium TMED119]
MTPEQITLVQESWAKVVPIKETAAELFYGRLFAEYPEVKPYFKGDMTEQGKLLMQMISTAVNGLENLDALLEPVKALGSRHKDYGVKQADYDKVGASLLWTLEQGLKEDFTEEVKAAWTETYTIVADVMIGGAEYAN